MPHRADIGGDELSKPIKRYSPEEKEIIAQMYSKGKNYEEIANRIGVTRYQIQAIILKIRTGAWGKECSTRFPPKQRGGWDSVSKPKKPKKEVPKGDTLDDDIKKAHMLGMSYGKYMALKALKQKGL